MNISKAEYEVLKRILSGEIIPEETEELRSLAGKDMIFCEIYGVVDEEIHSSKYKVTNTGVIAYEEYRFRYVTTRNASIRSWIAIIISVLALVISAINVYELHFSP